MLINPVTYGGLNTHPLQAFTALQYNPDVCSSWHEMGYYDLPAAIDYILNVTKNEKLSYIGHSMGTSMFFVLGATRPEYMRKVNAAVMMAPVAYIKDMPSPSFRFFHDLETPLNVSLSFLEG